MKKVEDISDHDDWETVQKPKKRKKNFVSQKKRQKKDQNIPTAEELNNLREAETMFHSNLFKMQVDELLKELKENVSRVDGINAWLKTFKDFLVNIPESSECLIKDFTLRESVQVPIIQTPESTKGLFTFLPPVEIKEIGSFTLGTMCSSTPVIDLGVEIPKACWQTMDFMNYRYHRKRAIYLSYIAFSLLEVDFISHMEFTYQNDCYLKPVLLITPKGTQSIKVCLTAYPNKNAFKLSRFLPSKNSVRSSWFFGTKEDDSMQPTPYYNSSAMSDLMLPSLSNYLKETISSQNVKDGIILLKLWSLQRGLSTGYGRLNGFILTMFVAYLIKKRKVTDSMSAYQVFRCSLLAFQKENFLGKGISLCDQIMDIPEAESHYNFFDLIFLDISGYLNICYYTTKETFLRVQHEAELGLQILEKESPDSFSALFLNKITFSKKFEYLLQFKGLNNFKKYIENLDMLDLTLDFGEDNIACVMPKICNILKTGLNERVLLIDVVKDPKSAWSICDAPPNPNLGEVTLGFLLNPDVPLSNLEKGPLTDHPKSKDFRKFWGEQSEMRRFQDGTIREAVYWPASTISDKRKVFSNMIIDILKRHLRADQNHFMIHGTEVDSILQLPKTVLSPEFPSYGTGEEAHMTLMQSFNSLSKQLRSLNGLPLLIASIQGSSPSFRFSEVFPPLSVLHECNPKNSFVTGHIMKLKDNTLGVPEYTPALKVIISLEGSGKWPDDVEAIKRVKAAFQLKIAELIKSQCSLIAVPFTTHTDIFKDGFVFRVIIACHKEIFLLKQVQTESGIVKIQENQVSRNLEISTEILPKVNSILYGLHQQHNTYGTACRLAKRWISSQLKHSFIHEITVELLVAHLYLYPEPYSCPCSPQVAFIRFLSLLIHHDWAMAPLIVNLNNELNIQEIEEINAAFSSQRSTLPPMVVVTPFDKRGVMWTKNMPSTLILKRIRILADASLKILENILQSTKISDIKAIFRPPLESYDVLIHLKRYEIPTVSYAVDVYKTDALPVFVPYKQNINEVYPIVEYNPVQKYLDELRENFSDFAIFLYDIYGGDFIAVVWKRSAFTPKELKISNLHCRTLYGDGARVIPDVESILEDFQILGSGIVKEIVKKTENWQIP